MPLIAGPLTAWGSALSGSAVPWYEVAGHLGITWEDEEALVHELAHAYDCVGDKAFDYVGTQPQVNRLIEEKYESADSDAANLAEVRTAAVTWLTLQTVGILSEGLKNDIRSSLWSNLRGDWQDRFTLPETNDKLEDMLLDQTANNTAGTLAAFLLSF